MGTIFTLQLVPVCVCVFLSVCFFPCVCVLWVMQLQSFAWAATVTAKMREVRKLGDTILLNWNVNLYINASSCEWMIVCVCVWLCVHLFSLDILTLSLRYAYKFTHTTHTPYTHAHPHGTIASVFYMKWSSAQLCNKCTYIIVSRVDSSLSLSLSLSLVFTCALKRIHV